jgi:hypothetical protein
MEAQIAGWLVPEEFYCKPETGVEKRPSHGKCIGQNAVIELDEMIRDDEPIGKR